MVSNANGKGAAGRELQNLVKIVLMIFTRKGQGKKGQN